MQFFIHYFSLALDFFNVLTGNLGAAIILFTLVIRFVLLPITLPSIKAQKKMMDLKPELDQLKKKHKGDATELQKAQMELYKKYNINPLAGCLPQLLQFGVLIVLYQTLLAFLKQPTFNGHELNFNFWWFNLSHPDALYILPILAGVSQLILSLMLMPATETPDVVPNNSRKRKIQEANKKEEDTAEMAATIQQQMLFMMPIMTGVFALSFPSGLSLYWVITTVFSIVQQYFISGPGGIATYSHRIQVWLKLKK
jgi:YidC/Oxa1 family membrane protein insertase